VPDIPPLPLSSPPSGTLLAAIVESSDDAIVSKNLNGIVTSWNKSAERIFGYTASEMMGEPILRLLPQDRKQEEMDILARLRRGERVDHFETIRVRKDGRLIDVSLTISPIRGDDGTIVGASKIARDITDQKRAARELAAAHEELKRANRMKVEFISTLSHELRTPLTAVFGWIQILKDSPTAQELADGLDIIERNVRVQSQLIDDLLDMSRIESGKIALDLQPLDLPAVIAAAVASVRPTSIAKGIDLTSDLGALAGVVMGDRNRVQQIIWNLLTNALKFTPRGGRVHVGVRCVDSHVEISVTDSGIGIPEEFIGHLFERFSQVDASTTRRHGGLGLGLSIVKHLVELHGGTVGAISPGIGRGSTFTIRFPIAPVQADAVPNGEGGRTSFGAPAIPGVKILIVDDDVDSAAIIALILRRAGGEVRTAHSMEEALTTFMAFKPEILVSDIGMPHHDGYELIARIRELPQGRLTPALALTALARNEDRTRALRAGFQMHVVKPVEASELTSMVRRLASLQPHER